LGPNAISNTLPAKVQPDSLVKDYTKKRWLILALLSVEIEILATHQVRVFPKTKHNLPSLLFVFTYRNKKKLKNRVNQILLLCSPMITRGWQNLISC
jgi:hypothetical protein